MGAMPTLLILVVLGQTPVDPAELAKAQSALESYYSRIKALHITYSEKSIFPDKKERTCSRDLLHAFPSLRMITVEPILTNLGQPDEELIERQTTTSIHQGQMISIDQHAKAYEVKSAADPLHYPCLPLEPLGLRAISTLNTPISDLLKFSEITSFEGEETIDGNRCIRVTVGPKIPAQVRPHYWSENAILKLHLAPDHSYLPVRMELLQISDEAPDKTYRMSLGSFKMVNDAARDARITFPHRLEVLFSNGAVIRYEIQSVHINRSVSPNDFALRPPNGFTVTKDGRPLTISGGTKEGDRRIAQSVDEAKRLLGSLEPPRASRRMWYAWPITVVGALLLGLLVAGFLKWRNGS